MNMLNLLKKISNRLNFIFYTHSSRYKLRYLYSYDRKRFIRHAGSLHHEEKEQKLASVIMAYHVVEKGLSMPERRLGFGHDAVLELISLIRDYSENSLKMIKFCMPSPSWTLTVKYTEKRNSTSVRISSRRWTACWRTSLPRFMKKAIWK